jgi:hypothetical protein
MEFWLNWYEQGAKYYCPIHKLINSVRKREQLSNQWKESIIVPVRKNGDKTDCNNYCVISMLWT